MRVTRIPLAAWLVPAVLVVLGASAVVSSAAMAAEPAVRQFIGLGGGACLAGLVLGRAAPGHVRVLAPLAAVLALALVTWVRYATLHAFVVSYAGAGSTATLAALAGVGATAAAAGAYASRWWTAQVDGTAVWLLLSCAAIMGTYLLITPILPEGLRAVIALIAPLPVAGWLQALAPRRMVGLLTVSCGLTVPFVGIALTLASASAVAVLVAGALLLVGLINAATAALGAHLGWRWFASRRAPASPDTELPAATLRS